MMSNCIVNSVSFCNVDDKAIEACLPAVKGSQPPPPTHACCSYVKIADQRCLCQYQHSYLIPAFGVNIDQVKKLPEKCGIEAITC
jgi:Probable lipid transfer